MAYSQEFKDELDKLLRMRDALKTTPQGAERQALQMKIREQDKKVQSLR